MCASFEVLYEVDFQGSAHNLEGDYSHNGKYGRQFPM